MSQSRPKHQLKCFSGIRQFYHTGSILLTQVLKLMWFLTMATAVSLIPCHLSGFKHWKTGEWGKLKKKKKSKREKEDESWEEKRSGWKRGCSVGAAYTCLEVEEENGHHQKIIWSISFIFSSLSFQMSKPQENTDPKNFHLPLFQRIIS